MRHPLPLFAVLFVGCTEPNPAAAQLDLVDQVDAIAVSSADQAVQLDLVDQVDAIAVSSADQAVQLDLARGPDLWCDTMRQICYCDADTDCACFGQMPGCVCKLYKGRLTCF